MLQKPELVDPDFSTLHLIRIVSHTYHQRLYLAQARIAHDGDPVARMFCIHHHIRCHIGSHASSLRLVALLLEAGKYAQGYIEHILLRPDQLSVGRTVAVIIAARFGQLERNLILIVIVLIVAAQTDEDRQLAVLQIGGVLLQGIGMGKHLDALVLAEIEGRVLIYRLCLAMGQILHHQTQSLLVCLDKLWLRWVLLAADTRRKHIVDRCLLGIFLQTDCTRLQGSATGCTQRLVVGTPFAVHQVERTETEHDRLLEVGEEHSHEADAGEIVDVSLALLKLIHRNAELIPGNRGFRVVSPSLGVFALIHDEVAAHHEIFRTDADVILEILLIFVQRIVLVDVLHIRCRFIGGIITLGTAFAVRRIALRVVDVLISVKDGRTHLIPVRASEIVIVIPGWVGKDTVEHRLVHLALYLVEIGTLVEFLLFGIGQAIESHILQGTASAGGGKCVCHGTLRRNLTPLRIGEAVAAIHRHSALIKLLAIPQDVLAHLAQVDVEVATVVGCIRLLSGIDERIKHPELDILHVCLLEIVGIQLAHHSTPVAGRIGKGTIRLQIGYIEVVRSRLRWIVSQIENTQGAGGSLIGALLAQREKLLYIHLSHVVVAQLLEVALDMTRSERTSPSGEERIDGVPGKAGTMETAGQPRLVIVIILEVKRRHTGDNPRSRSHHVDGSLGILEVINIRSIVLHSSCLARQKLGKLTLEGDIGRLGEMQERYLVEHVGKPLALLLPVQVDAPERILQRFAAHRHLVGERLFREMLQGSADLEIFGEFILPVESYHRLSHLSVIGIALQGDVDRRTGIDDALVEDGHLSGIVIHRVVGTLLQGNATCRHHYRTLRHIVGIEGDDIGCRALELSHDEILILFGYLPGDGLRTVIEFGEGIFLSLLLSHTLLHEIILHITAERFHLRHEHATIRYGIALHIIEVAIAARLVVVIKPVGTQHTDDRLVLHLRFRNVVDIDTRCITLIFHIEAELVLFHLRREIIYVLHHQVPVALLWIATGILQRLHEESLLGIGDIRGKLTHLIGHSAIGIFVCHGKNLVGLKTRLQRNISHRLVHGIFRGIEQTGTLQLLEIAAAYQSATFQDRGCLVDVTGSGKLTSHRCILGIRLVSRHHRSSCSPHRVAHLLVFTQVGQGDDVSGIRGGSRLVGYPDFHTVDGDTRQ